MSCQGKAYSEFENYMNTECGHKVLAHTEQLQHKFYTRFNGSSV